MTISQVQNFVAYNQPKPAGISQARWNAMVKQATKN